MTATLARPTAPRYVIDGDAQLCLLSDLEMHKAQMALRPAEELCAWCVQHGTKGCPACTQRRRKALRLAGAGRSLSDIAAELGINIERVARLLEQATDRRDVDAFRVSHVPNAEIRKAFERWRGQDPTHSASELARRAGFSYASHVERELGLIKTSASSKNAAIYEGRYKTTVSVANAEKLLCGLGYNPQDVERLIAGETLVA